MAKKPKEYTVTVVGEWTDEHTRAWQDVILRLFGAEAQRPVAQRECPNQGRVVTQDK